MKDEAQAAEGAALADPSSQPQSPEDQAADAVRQLLLKKPLYATIKGDDALMNAVDLILNLKSPLEFDQYCITCEQMTPWTIRPFKVLNSGGGSGNRYTVQHPLPTVRALNAVCLRKQHFYTYVLVRGHVAVQKIGQRPSMADIALGELKAIRGINAVDRRELGRALGLFSHDAPLGAFVYLRRVFERMIARAHEQFKVRTGSYLPRWSDLRMGERVRELSDALPPEISANAGVFALLSKGIHELSDEDAETLFPLIKAVIFEMLGDEERHRQAELARKETSTALQSAIARHSGPAQDEANSEDALPDEPEQ